MQGGIDSTKNEHGGNTLDYGGDTSLGKVVAKKI